MFAAGNDSRLALAALLGAGASIAARDRRGRSVLEYAAEHAAAHSLLQDRCAAALPCRKGVRCLQKLQSRTV